MTTDWTLKPFPSFPRRLALAAATATGAVAGQGLRFEAEGHVPPESIATFDPMIRDTFAKLAALGDLRTYAEKPMEIGVGLDAT